MLPADLKKRNYRFKSNTRKDRLNYIIAIIVSAVAFVVLWFCL